MKRFSFSLLALTCITLAGCQSHTAMHASGSHHMTGNDHVIFDPGHLQWQAAPNSLPAGWADFVVLEGDPGAPGFYTIRLKFPAGYRVPAHWHSQPERITVLAGEFWLGDGDKFDYDGLQPIPADGYTIMPAHMHHYAMTKVPTIIQITSTGPFDIHYLNPEEDPRNQKPAPKPIGSASVPAH